MFKVSNSNNPFNARTKQAHVTFGVFAICLYLLQTIRFPDDIYKIEHSSWTFFNYFCFHEI